MKRFIMMLMLTLALVGANAQNGYNPANPPDPQAPVKQYTLTCQVEPSGAGYVNIDKKLYAQGSSVTLKASNYSNYKFRCWMLEGETLSTNASYTFTMPAKNVNIVALFTFDPEAPKDPDAPVVDPGKEDPDPSEPDTKPDYNPSTPGNPGANTFDAKTGIVIVGDFTAGNLRSAIYSALGGSPSSEVRQIIVQGNIANGDVSAANDYQGCTLLDLSRCPNLTEIPSYAYYGNTSLEQIILPSSVTRIGNYAFYNASKLAEITCYASVPPTIDSNAFANISTEAVAYVPQKSLSAYQAANGWKNLTIKEGKNKYAVDFTVSDIAFASSDITPKGKMTITWKVNNEGSSDSQAGWKEYIYLSDDDNTSPLLYTINSNNTLAAQKSMDRSATFSLPAILGVSGKVKAKVVVVPSSNAGESLQAQANNANFSQKTALLGKSLYLSSVSKSIEEGTSGIAVTLIRSGNCSQSETASLSIEPEGLANIPSTVSWKQGDNTVRFIISIPDNNVVNEIDSIHITATSEGYDAVTLPVEFIDNDKYALSMTLDKSTYAEGDIIHATISVGKAQDKDLPITLNVEHTKRFRLPSAVVIKSGEKQVLVDIPIINDDIPSNDEGIELKASAEGYDIAKSLFILTDDDVPAIEMTLQPSIISEDAGSEAIHAIITRKNVVDNKITLRLSDDGDGAVFYNNTITMEKGVTEVTVPIGVKDNDKVDGTREVNLTAAIYISSCNCNAVGTKQAVVSKTITILDNDGPTLAISVDKSVILEGDTNGATFTLKRNNSTDKALPVKLSVDAEDIVLPAQVTIPPGNESTTFTLYAKNNETQEGNRVVHVKAECDGYTMGVAYVLVTDQTLPDMSIEGIEVTPAVVEVNQKYKVTVKVKNVGAAEVPARSTVTLRADNEELTLTIPEAISVGAEKTLTAVFTAPGAATVCTINAECNANRALQELQSVNNATSIKFEVQSPYTMMIATDKEAYNMGDVVHLKGQVTSKTQSVAGLKVEPYVMYQGARQALTATTASDGSFALDYTLPKTMGGDFSFGACLPEEDTEKAVATVGVYGMTRAESSYYKLRVYKGEPYRIKIPIKNLSSLNLSGIKATIEDASGHYKVKVKTLKNLPGNEQADLELEVTSLALTTTSTWEKVMVNISSEEGAQTSFPIYCFCTTHQAVLSLSTSSITSTVNKNAPRLYPVIITNTGMGETGKISVDIPKNQKFVSLASSAELPSLATGDSATVMLKFNPEGLDVNVRQTGSLAINCEKSDGVTIAYDIKVVSQEKGTLLVRVMDENTEYGNANGEHPYVANALVTVKDYNNGVALYNAITDQDGYARFTEINEGAYTILVTASKHSSYTQNVMVGPGETTEHVAYVSYQAISVSFNVEETTVEDKYDITSEFVYETQVPVPVVVMDCPDQIDLQKVVDGGELLYNIVLTNKGLINADNVCLSLPQEEGINFVALTPFSGLTLTPGQQYTIPVHVSRAVKNQSRKKAITRGIINDAIDDGIEWGLKKMHCNGDTYLGWEYPCTGNKKALSIAKYVKYMLRTCEAGQSSPEEKKPQKKVTIDEPDNPRDYPEIDDPQVRYWKTTSQVDLYAMYQYTCKISCSLQCLPLDAKQYASLSTKEGRKALYKCVFNNWFRDYGARPKFNTRGSDLSALESLYDNYSKKYNLLMTTDSITTALNAEILNAPQLMEDEATYSQVLEGVQKVDINLIARHDNGTLYKQTAQQLYDENIINMPQQMADWYDFSLPLYIERRVNLMRQADGLPVTSDNLMDAVLVAKLKAQKDSCENVMKKMGFVGVDDLLESVAQDSKVLSESSSNTCATVKFQINQQMVLTRQAFRGTMTVENSTNESLTKMNAAITATNEAGEQATAHEMQISLESMDGFTLNSDGTWTLEPGATGTATYLFIPTKYAAPTKAEMYSFGGTLYFYDGEQDQARSLYPCSLTVKPSPELDLTYFMQRDLYGDNPLTEDVKEPIIPAEFTLLVHNKGLGEAQNVKVITHQPEVVENEKGLAVDFSIVSSSLNGKNKSLALATDIATDFGSIPAGSCSYATWDIASSLLGHIKEYKVGYTHVTSYDNPDLSLVDKVTMHELIHSINTKIGDKTYRAWIVNDEVDVNDLPDQIYFSNGTNADVQPLPDAAEMEVLSDTQCRINVNAVTKGWFYSRVDNLMNKNYRIAKITEVGTGKELDPENFWTSLYVMLDGKDPEERPMLHIVDKAGGAGEMSYIIDFDTTNVSTGIQDVILPMENENGKMVKNQGIYNLVGIKVSSADDQETIRRLPSGIYIINKRKVLKK